MGKIKKYFGHLGKSNKILYTVASIGLIIGLSFAIIAGGGIFSFASGKDDGIMQTAATDIWTNHTSGKDFANSGHDGTDIDPYEITNAEDLAQLAKDVNGGKDYNEKYFKQVEDIDLGDYEWIPIGTQNKSFSGSYDGNGYEIKNLYITNPQETVITYLGIWGYVSYKNDAWGEVKYATIKNVILQSGHIKISSSFSSINVYAGGICGGAFPSGWFAGILIENCVNRATISISSSAASGQMHIGGICGDGSSSEITRCYNEGSIIMKQDTPASLSQRKYIAGICGTEGDVEYCINAGTLYGGLVGGISGSVTPDGGRIANCINQGILIGEYVGGIVNTFITSSAGDSFSFSNCFMSGHIQASEEAQPFIIGKMSYDTNRVSIDSCAFIGTSNVDLSFSEKQLKYTQSYIKCNMQKLKSSEVDASWLDDWVIVPNINNGLPIQKKLFTIADVNQTTVEQLAEALQEFSI